MGRKNPGSITSGFREGAEIVNECNKDFMNHTQKNQQNILWDFPGQIGAF